MRHPARTFLLLGLTAAAVLATAEVASAKPRRWRGPNLGTVFTPMGLQGTAGGTANVPVGFVLFDMRRRPVDVEVQYGFDANGDERISDDEYRPASEDRLDERSTRARRGRRLFASSGDQLGAANAFVWRAAFDLPGAQHRAGRSILRTEQGRAIPDPFDSLQPLFSADLPGVRLRMRPVSATGRRRFGDWQYTGSFSLSNNHAPRLEIDAVASPSPGAVVVDYTAFDADSEDRNGNGLLDVDLGEDRNQDGELETAPVGIAVDWYLLGDGEDPSGWRQPQLEALRWNAATRLAGMGDSDAGLPSAQTPAGRSHQFAWDVTADWPDAGSRFLLRARLYDSAGELGEWVYWTVPVAP